MTDDDITRIIIGEAIRIHRSLGPRLFEAAYEEFLARPFRIRGSGSNGK